MSDDNALTKFVDGIELAETVTSHGIGLVKLVAKVLDPTPGFIAKRDQMEIEWWAAVVNLVNDLARRMPKVEQEAFRARLADEEAIGILANYVMQAHQEPMKERMRMLQHAAASLANMQLGIAELARVQRVLRELEPDDVVTLYCVAIACGRLKDAPGDSGDVGALRLKIWQDSGAESLESSGCIRVQAKGGGFGAGTHEELTVTRTGMTIIRALRSYIRAREPDLSQLPGHETTSDFRTEAEARAVIKGMIGLEDALHQAKRASFEVGYHSAVSRNDLKPNRKTVLGAPMSREYAAQLKEMTTPEVVGEGQPVTSIFVQDVFDHFPGDDPRVFVNLAGPHDVLRWLAYDLDAWWA
jgi:hypothetical protein